MDKNNTGFAAEFIVAAELARRDFNVAITFGNTKKIDSNCNHLRTFTV